MSEHLSAKPQPPALDATRIWSLVKTPVTLLVLLAVLAFGAWGGKWFLDHSEIVEPPIPCVNQELKVLKTQNVTVKVENGGSQRGLARAVTKGLSAKGFITLSPSNIEDRILKTEIVGAKEDSPEVQLVAGFFKGAVVKGDGRIDGTVSVRVGNEFGEVNQKAPTQVEVPGGVVCLASPTPTPTPSKAKKKTSKTPTAKTSASSTPKK